MIDVITVHCTHCDTAFPVDPAKVPEGGIRARCSACDGIFRVEKPPASTPSSGAREEVVTQEEEFKREESDPAIRTAPGEEREREVEEATDRHPGTGLEEPESESPPSTGKETREVRPEPESGIGEAEPSAAPETRAEPAGTTDEKAPAAESRPTFGHRTPEEKAERLARVLVSDMISYNPELHRESLARGTLARDFEEEIEKSWEEYVEQVGEELATSTPYWTEALNEILARGERVF